MPAQSLENYLRKYKMSNYDSQADKLRAHLEQLKTKHEKLHEEIDKWHGIESTPEIRKLKTHKLFIKDEIYRIQRELKSLGAYTNGRA